MLQRAGSFSLHSVRAASPSGRRRIHRERDHYEEDLAGMVTEPDLSRVERLQASNATPVRRRHELSDHDIAFALFMQNVQELADFAADRAFAQRLALGRYGELDDPARLHVVTYTEANNQ
jgi:hypothetical protein